MRAMMMRRPIATRSAKPQRGVQRKARAAANLPGSLSHVPMVRRQCAACGGPENDMTKVMPKLDVGAVNDPLEAEADSIADQVMAKREGAVAPVLAGRDKVMPSRAQGEEGETINATSGDLTQGGSALPEATRAFFEARMGRDFSGVRMHRGHDATHLNGSIGARAFTYRNHIWLGPNESGAPTHTMAHEMAHVMQQTPSPAAQSPVAQTSTTAPVVQRVCSDSERIKKQYQVNSWCKTKAPGRGCSPKDSCGHLKQKIKNNQMCARARNIINSDCFDGGDAGHIKAMQDAHNAQANCMMEYRSKCEKDKKKLEKVPQTQPQSAPKKQPGLLPFVVPIEVPSWDDLPSFDDLPSWDDLSTEQKAGVTVLVVAGVVYVVISEGSRIIPVRNLVPTP